MYNNELISYFLTKTYVLGTQKNHLNEVVLLAPKTYDKIHGQENIHNLHSNYLDVT